MQKISWSVLSGIFLLLVFNSCTSDDSAANPAVVTFEQTGLLGQEVSIQMSNIPVGNLQVFFDLEEAAINYVSDDEIIVTVPRTVQSATPTLKIVDLTTNETVLNEVFGLKTPIISGLSSNEIGFDQVLSIYGENFDVLEDDIKVYVNNVEAEITNTNYQQ